MTENHRASATLWMSQFITQPLLEKESARSIVFICLQADCWLVHRDGSACLLNEETGLLVNPEDHSLKGQQVRRV